MIAVWFGKWLLFIVEQTFSEIQWCASYWASLKHLQVHYSFDSFIGQQVEHNMILSSAIILLIIMMMFSRCQVLSCVCVSFVLCLRETACGGV